MHAVLKKLVVLFLLTLVSLSAWCNPVYAGDQGRVNGSLLFRGGLNELVSFGVLKCQRIADTDLAYISLTVTESSSQPIQFTGVKAGLRRSYGLESPVLFGEIFRSSLIYKGAVVTLIPPEAIIIQMHPAFRTIFYTLQGVQNGSRILMHRPTLLDPPYAYCPGIKYSPATHVEITELPVEVRRDLRRFLLPHDTYVTQIGLYQWRMQSAGIPIPQGARVQKSPAGQTRLRAANGIGAIRLPRKVAK